MNLLIDTHSIDVAMRNVHDGERPSSAAIRSVDAALDRNPKLLEALPKTTLLEAKKDPAGSRGRRIQARGHIADIHKIDRSFEGTMVAGSTPIYFVTTKPTPGIVDGSWARVDGVFVQEYDYANVSGGQTRAALIVGELKR